MLFWWLRAHGGEIINASKAIKPDTGQIVEPIYQLISGTQTSALKKVYKARENLEQVYLARENFEQVYLEQISREILKQENIFGLNIRVSQSMSCRKDEKQAWQQQINSKWWSR